MALKIFFTFVFFASSVVISFDDPPTFGNRITLGIVANDNIDEASGLSASYRNSGVLWTHNDSGGENRIFAIGDDGSHKGTFYLDGVENRDWEDIVVGPGPDDDTSYIYIADIGDNSAQYSTKFIYRVAEPLIPENPEDIVTIQDVSIISLIYPDGARDAETLMLDPLTKDIYILGKRDSKARLYRLSFPQSTFSLNQAELVLELTLPNDPGTNTPYYYLTAGDISIDGTEIIVKSYSNVYYWQRNDSLSISEALSVSPILLPYTKEPQGEAICWQNEDNNGFYTLSEENISYNGTIFTFPAELYFYPRQVPVGVKENNSFDSFELNQNYPNPFNPSTTIKYSIPLKVKNQKSKDIISNRIERGLVQLRVYDILGKEVAILVNEEQKPGIYEVQFNASMLSSGIYFFMFKSKEFSKIRKMLLLR